MENQALRPFGLILRALSTSIFIVIGATTSPLSANPPESFNLQNSQWQVRITPARLGFWGKPFGVAQEITLASPTDQAERIAGLTVRKDGLSWRVPQKELTVEVRLSESDLSIRLTTTREQALEWPTTGADPHAVAAIFPEDDLRSEVCFGNSEGRLFLNTSHQFLKRDGLPPYEICFVQNHS